MYANPPVCLGDETLLEYTRRGEQLMARYLDDYQLEREPSASSVSGFDAAVYQYRYAVRLASGRMLRFRCQYWIAHSDKAEFCIPLEWPVAEHRSAAQLDSVLHSLRLW